MGKDTSKRVKYRRRHKVLDHVPERDTNHKFEGRMPMEVPQGGASGPVFCSVLDYQAGTIESIVMNNDNYSDASKSFDNRPIQDQHDPLDTGKRRSIRRSTSTRPMANDPEISTSSRRRQQSSRSSQKMDSHGTECGLSTEPNRRDNNICQQSEMYPPHQPAQQQTGTHLRLEVEAPHMYASQAQIVESSEQLSWLTVIEDKKDHHTAYGYSVYLPNGQPAMFSPHSHEQWSPSFPFDISLPDHTPISSGGEPLSSVNNQFEQLLPQTLSTNTMDHIPQIYYPIWPQPAVYPSSSTDHSSYGEYSFSTVYN